MPRPGELRPPCLEIEDPADRLWWAVFEQCARDVAARDPVEREEAIDWLREAAAPVLAAEYGIDAGAVDQMIAYRTRRPYNSTEALYLFNHDATGTGAKRGRLPRTWRHIPLKGLET